MKKLSILSAIFGLAFVGAASAANITIFHSPHCPHCHHAREFISSTLIYEYPELKKFLEDMFGEHISDYQESRNI